MAVKYISPTGFGDKSGSSTANAAPISALNSMIKAAGAGGTVNLLADQGVYKLTGPLSITASGADGAPVTIHGVSSTGGAMAAQFEGTRPANWVAGSPTGNELFKLLTGASNLTFENISIANVGTAFRAGGALSNLTIENVTASNVQRFFEDYASGSATDATVNGLTIRNVDVEGFSKGVIRLKYDTHNVVIENVHGDSQRQDGDNFAIGVHIEGTAHDIVIRKTVMENATDTTNTYWNGDGFATERQTYNIRFEDTVSRGNTDAGYDLKSTNTTLVHALAEDNARNYRIWGEATIIDSVALDPHKRGGINSTSQIWVSANAKLNIVGGAIADSGTMTAVFRGEGGTITVSGTTIIYADNAKLTSGANLTGLDSATMDKVAATGDFSVGTDLTALLTKLGIQAVHTDAPVVDTSPPATPPAPSTTSGTGGTTPATTPDGALLLRHVSTEASETHAATSGRDLFDFTAAQNGSDSISGFGKGDILLTRIALADNNKDGIITFGSNGALDLGGGVGTAKIAGLSAGLRYLGQTSEGYLYGAANARPSKAVEGKLGVNDAFSGDRSDKKINKFFFDTGLHQDLGDDLIARFGSKDAIITTSLLGSDQVGSTLDATGGHFNLVDHGADVGSLTVAGMNGSPVSTLEYDGSVTVGDLTYFVYSAVGSTTDVGVLLP